MPKRPDRDLLDAHAVARFWSNLLDEWMTRRAVCSCQLRLGGHLASQEL